MMITLTSIGTVYLLGVFVIAFGIQQAPEAYEDESGFHLVWQNNDPQIPDVACVWEDSFMVPA